MTIIKLWTTVKTGLNMFFRKHSHKMEETKAELWH